MSDNRRGNLLDLPDCILSDVNKPFAKFWGSQVNLVSSKPMSFWGGILHASSPKRLLLLNPYC